MLNTGESERDDKGSGKYMKREFHGKPQGPADSQMGHSSLSVGKLRTWQRPQGSRLCMSTHKLLLDMMNLHGDNGKESARKTSCFREPYEVKASRTVLTGGMRETYRQVTRPVPTHCSVASSVVASCRTSAGKVCQAGRSGGGNNVSCGL